MSRNGYSSVQSQCHSEQRSSMAYYLLIINHLHSSFINDVCSLNSTVQSCDKYELQTRTESDQHLFHSHVIPMMFLLVISLLEVVIVHSDVREGWAYFREII